MAQERAWNESFDLYPSNVSQTGYGLLSEWLVTGGTFRLTLEAGRFGGQCLRTGTDDRNFVKAVPSTTEAVIGIAYFHQARELKNLIAWLSSGMNEQFKLQVDALNRLQLYRGATLVAQTALEGIQPETWNYIEFGIRLHDSTGACVVKVDGQELAELTLTNIDTKSSTDADIGAVRLYSNARTGAALDERDGLDDIYCEWGGWTPVGEGRLETLPANSDVSAGGWTPSTGATLFGVIDELPANHADYLSATTAGNEFRVGFADLSTIPSTIYGVEVQNISQKDEAGTRTLRNKLWAGAVEWDGATQALQLSSFTIKRDWLKLNPDGAVAWSAAAVNSLEGGAEIMV